MMIMLVDDTSCQSLVPFSFVPPIGDPPEKVLPRHSYSHAGAGTRPSASSTKMGSKTELTRRHVHYSYHCRLHVRRNHRKQGLCLVPKYTSHDGLVDDIDAGKGWLWWSW